MTMLRNQPPYRIATARRTSAVLMALKIFLSIRYILFRVFSCESDLSRTKSTRGIQHFFDLLDLLYRYTWYTRLVLREQLSLSDQFLK